MKVELLNYPEDLETIIAKAAGICYDSKVNNPKQLVRRLKADGHLATFRFAHITFQVSEFSRSCSMQVLRHKFLDFLQRSQRYCKEFEFDYVIPPSIQSNKKALYLFKQAMEYDQEIYDELINQGIKAEDARYVLPNACHTAMNITGSVQAWYDFLYGNAGRLQKAAQWEIRAIAIEIEKQLAEIAPTIFSGNKGK